MSDKEAWIRIYEALGAQFAGGSLGNKTSLINSTDFAFESMKVTLKKHEDGEKSNG